MGIRIFITISLGLTLTIAQAGTNSWTYTGANPNNYFWDIQTSWSLTNRPSLNDNFNFITNATTKTVTIDSFDTSTPAITNSLAITNLTVAGTGNTTNTLSLFNGGTNVPLRIFNSLTISSGGALQISNGFLSVDEPSGTFQVDGALRIFSRARVQARTITIGNGTILHFALGTNSFPVAVSNNLTVASTLNVTDGGGFTSNTYTLFTYGGTLIDNGLTLGTIPAGYTASINSNATQVQLIVGYQSIVASFAASPTNGVAPLPVTFTDTSTGLITNRFWDFGDSTTNIVTNTVVHTYAAGTYTVALTTCGPGGCSTIIQSNLITVVSAFTPLQQWQLQYFGCTNSVTCPQAAGNADPDGDGMSNTNEFLAGFNPTNNAAYLHVISIAKTNSDMRVTYLGSSGDSAGSAGPKTNVLEFTTGAPNGSYSNNFVSAGQTNILSSGTGLGVVTNMVDTGGATNTPSRFYRVRVLVP